MILRMRSAIPDSLLCGKSPTTAINAHRVAAAGGRGEESRANRSSAESCPWPPLLDGSRVYMMDDSKPDRSRRGRKRKRKFCISTEICGATNLDVTMASMCREA